MNPVDITTLPPPPGAMALYWPYIVIALSILMSTIGGVWTWWVNHKQTKLSYETTSAETRTSFKIKQMEQDFERQKQFQEDIQEQLREQRQHILELMTINHKLLSDVRERDTQIAERDRQITTMERKILELETTVSRLDAEIKVIEGQRGIQHP